MTTKRHEERASAVLRDYWEGVEGPAGLVKLIASALAASEQELVKEMMQPNNKIIKTINACWTTKKNDKPRRLYLGVWWEGHLAMLTAFCAEHAIPLPETEDVSHLDADMRWLIEELCDG